MRTWFKIAMDDALGVEVSDCVDEILHDENCFFLAEPGVG